MGKLKEIRGVVEKVTRLSVYLKKSINESIIVICYSITEKYHANEGIEEHFNVKNVFTIDKTRELNKM